MEAQWELKQLGAVVVEPLARSLPTLNRFGQLHAIEILEALGDARVGPAIIGLLHSGHDTVREWAARALAELRVVDAVPDLERAYARCLRRGIPLDWTEPLAIRDALQELGPR